MYKLIWTIIGIIAYFGLGWIAKDIVFSMIEITDETTLKDLTNYEFVIYSAIAVIVSFIGANLGENIEQFLENPIAILSAAIIIIPTFVFCLIPLSTGAVILYNIINIGVIIGAIYTNDNIG